MKEFMPEQYASAWGIEKKIFKEYKKHQGLSALEAKNVYTKTARALPTYGVTFFLVKEKQKDKKKLVPRLLGISADSILRLDEVSKEILQQWPLTHVKTYHAAKGEIFTLNFGDYSEKEYSVKTLDAYRIRDILEDYIDLIRKRMLASYSSVRPDTAYVTTDVISASQANVVQHVSNNQMKVVEQCFVGPSQIVSHEIGKDVCHGTQIVTVQQVIVSGKGNQQQQGVKGEVGMRGDMSIPFTRRLNRLNANSVKIVSLLTVPSDRHMEDARKIVDAMNEDLPYVRDGVQETIDKQTSDEDKKKLQNQMNELDELMRTLTECSGPGKTDSDEVGDAAMQVADLTTQMYFSLDTKLRRRSKIISRSRPSFVEDERSRRALRKASFVAAAAGAAHAMHDAHALLAQEYSGPSLDAQRSLQLEAAAVDKLGNLNAAVAHYILAHSDPKNVDYEAAVTSMNTIHELMPEFCQDAQALASSRDPLAKKQILLDAKAICDAIKKICSSTGMEDREKLQEASREYAEASGRLVFTFCKGRNSEKENEMLDLADEVAAQTSRLLMSAQQLAQAAAQEPAQAAQEPVPAAALAALDAAGVQAADAAKDVILQVQLCAPTIGSPHCRSAVTAAAQALAAAAQALVGAGRPLLEHAARRARALDLHHQLMQLTKALDKLKDAYGGSGGYDEGDVFDNPDATQEQQRLKFINTMSGNHKQWNQVEELLTMGAPEDVQEAQAAAAQAQLARALAQLNAAVAALLAATADRDRPDYVTAELAINTINELMPQVVQDTKIASTNKDEEARKAMMEHIKALCDASKGICTSSEDSTPESRGEAIAKFTNASGKLVFGISHRGNPDKENKILELTEDACGHARRLAAGAQQLAEAAGGHRGADLDARAPACATAARALHAAARVTAPSISEPRCRSVLLAAVDKLSSTGQDLASAWKPLHDHAMHKRQVQGLEHTLEQLGDKLDALKGACISSNGVQQVEMSREQQKLQFGRTMAATNERILKAQKALDEPIPPAQSGERAEALQLELSGRLGALNAAVAALLAAAAASTAGRESADHRAVEDAATAISELLPHVVQGTRSTSANKDEATRAAMLDLIRELCEASRAVCAGADGTNKQGLSDAVAKFSDASGKLIYVVNPRSNANRENQIMGLTAGACSQTSQLLSGVQQVARAAGGAAARALDARGAALADAAQALLVTAQVTAPSISEPHCEKALLSSIDKLSLSARALAESWRPLLQEPQHCQQAGALQAPLQQLETQLEALRKACHIPDEIPDEDVHKSHELPSEQKVQFGRRMSLVTEQIQKAQKALDKPPPPPLGADKAEAVQQRLSGRLGELNAAIAALLAATSERDNTDYKAAEQAVRTITDLIPHVVQDTQSTSANKDEATRAAMLDLIRELCEASRAVCATADGTNPQGLSDAVSKFSDASGKLVYVVNPRVNTEREKLIDDQSAGVCNKVSQLLSGVQQLSEAVGGAPAQELDCRGAAVADAAQNLLATSQVTAPSISEPHCKKALLSSIDKLSTSGCALAESWQPLLQEPQHRQQAAALQAPLQQLDTQLEALRKTCQIPDGVPQTTELPRELQKLQFVKTMAGAKEQIQKAQMALDKPIPPPQSTEKAGAVQQRLSGRLGELNAAIAALLAATADNVKPDYKTAEEAMKTITQLMPHVVQDTQSTSANKDEATRAAMLDLIRELCEASRAVCAGADGTHPQGVSDAASKFSKASGKLVYVVNPRANADREKQVVALSAGACQKASKLLATVQKLPTTVEGRTGQELEAKSAAVHDAAIKLISTAKVTASSISHPHCKKAMLSSAEQLSSSAQDLVGSWKPLLQGYSWSTLKQPLQQLETQLEDLRTVCQVPNEDIQTTLEIPREQQKLQFGRSMSLVTEQIQKAQKALDKPPPPPLGADKAEAVQQRLSGRLGELNAAIAALLAATADRENPDYVIAEKAAKTITEVLPRVVEDTQSTSANKDEATRAAMLDLIRELCEASRAVCAGADGTHNKGLSDAVSKFSEASGKLVYVVNPRVNEKREKQIMSLTAGACNNASQLLSGVQQLSEAVGGAPGQELDYRGAAVADAAQNLLLTSQITAPCISEPHCRATLLSSIDKLSLSARALAKSWQPVLQEPQHCQQAAALQAPLQQLHTQLEALRKACQIPDGDGKAKRHISHEEQRLQFITSMSQAKEQLRHAQKALDKPIPPPQSSDKAEVVQQRLSGRLGQLNAAIASLLSATADREKPYYQTADKAVKTIVDLLPHVIQDTQSASANKDPASRAAMLDLVKQLSAASEAVCAGADGTNPQGLSEAVGKFTDASGKLVYVLNPQDKHAADHIVELAVAACNKSSQVLLLVQQVSRAVAAGRARPLDDAGAALADAAQALLASAQVTAPSISEPHCKAALLDSANLLSTYSEDLAECWKPLLLEPKHQKQATALQQLLPSLEAQIEALRKACAQTKKVPPPPARAAPRAPPRGSAADGASAHATTEEFLHRMRLEEEQGYSPQPAGPEAASSSASSPRPLTVMTDDEKRMHQQFMQAVDDAHRSIKNAKDQGGAARACPALSAGAGLRTRARLQRDLALASVEVAALLAANYGHTVDYPSASKSMQTLPQLMSNIVEDGKVLSSTVNEESRKAFLKDMLEMCDSTLKICDTAKNEREKLNDVAVEFGDKSSKLLYVVSNDVDASLEKEITSRAKAIGDGVAQISVRARGVCGAARARRGCVSAAAGDALCAAAARCQDAAGKLLYTAKLVAPSIYETPCQEALYKSADCLTTELRTLSDSWKPFSTDPQHANTIKELKKDADNLERILEGLKSDVKGGKIGQRKEMEKLVVEDTPMRQLTLRIMEDAKKLSESTELSAALRREYAQYCARLRDALRALDLATARCRRTPHDTNKRRELENAVQNLQMVLLQSRPSRTNKEKTNIVDLRDFITEVTSEVDKLEEAASSLKVATAADKKTLQEVIGHSQKMSQAAYKLTHSDDVSGFDTTFDNILDVDQFGQECDDVIKDINAQLQKIEDSKARNALYCKMLPLTESCNMLRFATKSGISTAKSVALEAALDDLEHIEARVIGAALCRAPGGTPRTTRQPRPLSPGPRAALARAARAPAGSARAPLAAYVAACAAGADPADHDNRNRLLKHLYKLVHLLKTQAVFASKRIATWQPIDDPELTAITEQILQEIENPESQFLPESGNTKKILNESDLTKLLIPSPAKVVGDAKHQESKLSQLATKLSSMSSALTLGIASPESLSRSAHATAEAAVELSSVARGCKNKKKPVQCERIEEAVQEMTFATYGVLQRAQRACLEPGERARRRLQDASLLLNGAIDELMARASSGSEVKKACGSMERSLLVQETAPVPGTLPYEQCCEALNQHQEVVYKLKSDQPMTRTEFARSLGEVNEAVCKTTQISSQCAYLISVSETDIDIAKKGPVDVPQIQKSIESLQDSCMAIIGSFNVHQAKEESEDLYQRIQDFSRAIDEAQLKVKDADVKATLAQAKASVTTSATELWNSLKEDNDMSVLSPASVCLLERVSRAHAAVERCAPAPAPRVSADTQGRCDELTNNSKTLLSSTMALVKDVNSSEDDFEVMTWVTFNTSKKKLLDAYDALVKSIRVNGQRAGILEGTPEDETDDLDAHNKTYLETQVDLANKWLSRPMCKTEVKANGQQAVRHVIDIATKISEELKGNEREEMRNIITETEELLTQCALIYDSEKYSVLMDRVKELKKAIQRGVVTRVVEDFIEVDDSAGALDIMVDSEEDDQKRKFLLERKIAELLAQMARVSRTARAAAAAAGPRAPAAALARCTQRTELLAPMLVQAAQDRIASPNDQTVIENYKRLLAQYAECVCQVRSLCDAAVDPMDFVQAAGDTMQRMREESSAQNDVQKGHRTSEAIIKLANRSIEVSMSSPAVRLDPSLRDALLAAQRRVLAATPAQHARASTLPDWKESTDEVLRTTGEVESTLRGENIFKSQPTAHTTNQQIYTVARDLHESVREWSARDNEIVAAARRVAVLMARLAEYMETDKKQSLISASKSIVSESHEVAVLARKLAHECTDVRIKTNLLQTCERIPTISAQLKMLTTVKGSSLGHQGSKEDSEAMDMLVGNAQSLMMSIQEVVKAAAGASVKIMSQRGPRLRWVRKNYY